MRKLSRVGVHAHEEEFCMRIRNALTKPWSKKRPNALPLFWKCEACFARVLLFGKARQTPPVTCLMTKEDKRHGKNRMHNAHVIDGQERKIRKET